MTRPYSEDIRERALARADAGETVRSIAAALQISPSCVTKWKNLRRNLAQAGEGAGGARDQDGRARSVDFCSRLWNQLPTEPAMPKQKLTRNLRILAEFYFRNPSA
jgi:hypothetical protein